MAVAVITKDPYTYSIRFLRQERILRDHGDALGRPMSSDVTRTRQCTTSGLSRGALRGARMRLRNWRSFL
jgi:hypothetical protein